MQPSVLPRAPRPRGRSGSAPRLRRSVRPRRTGRHDREVRPADPELDGQLSARRVDQHVRNEHRRDAIGPALAEDVGPLHQLVEATDTGAEDDAGALRLVAVPQRPPWLPWPPRGRTGRARSRFRARFGVTASAGSKSLTSAAILTGKSSVSNARMKLTPLRPSTSPFQVVCMSFPSGVTAPTPVMATRLIQS